MVMSNFINLQNSDKIFGQGLISIKRLHNMHRFI
jgi:hypothetical protein